MVVCFCSCSIWINQCSYRIRSREGREIGEETWGQVMKGCEYKSGRLWKICKVVYRMGWVEVAMRGVVMTRHLDLAIRVFPGGLTLFELKLRTLWLRPSYSWKTKTRHYQHRGIYHWGPHIKSEPTKPTTFSRICFGLKFLSCSLDGVLDTEIPTRNSKKTINQ